MKGKLTFGILLVALLGGSFAVGTHWAPGKRFFKRTGLVSPRPEPALAPLRNAGTPPVPGEGPEIRIAEPEVRFAAHSPIKTEASKSMSSEMLPAERTELPVLRTEELVYAVQVGAFKSEDDARQLTHRLTNRGYSAYIVIAEVPLQGLLHKVRVGRYKARTGADQMAKTILQKEGLQSFVTYR